MRDTYAIPVPGHPGLVLRDLGGRWAEITCTTCNAQVTFVTPTPERVSWFARTHQCGRQHPQIEHPW